MKGKAVMHPVAVILHWTANQSHAISTQPPFIASTILWQ
jgi:hypothetical protein